MGQRHSEYEGAADGFYIEPSWTVEGLFTRGPHFLHGHIHDPFAGTGTVVDVAQGRGFIATGSDIRDRASGRFPVRDFFEDEDVYANIVANPPTDLAALVAVHALEHVIEGGRVAILVPLGFLASQGRFPLLNRQELDTVLILSRRPSMPPGELLLREGEGCRHSGSIDFVWVIWQHGRGRA
jgi:hypothetical protein